VSFAVEDGQWPAPADSVGVGAPSSSSLAVAMKACATTAVASVRQVVHVGRFYAAKGRTSSKAIATSIDLAVGPCSE
jgi:hypothetical protein